MGRRKTVFRWVIKENEEDMNKLDISKKKFEISTQTL